MTSADVWAAYTNTIKAAENAPAGDEIRSRVRALIDSANARWRIRGDDHWTGRGTAMTRGDHGASAV